MNDLIIDDENAISTVNNSLTVQSTELALRNTDLALRDEIPSIERYAFGFLRFHPYDAESEKEEIKFDESISIKIINPEQLTADTVIKNDLKDVTPSI